MTPIQKINVSETEPQDFLIAGLGLEFLKRSESVSFFAMTAIMRKPHESSEVQNMVLPLVITLGNVVAIFVVNG